jgi:hypothetical protein
MLWFRWLDLLHSEKLRISFQLIVQTNMFLCMPHRLASGLPAHRERGQRQTSFSRLAGDCQEQQNWHRSHGHVHGASCVLYNSLETRRSGTNSNADQLLFVVALAKLLEIGDCNVWRRQHLAGSFAPSIISLH